ncbi:MAG: PKD domain-containing protein [Bacteroidetes bacterium]|nr:PKD domain-containing protein [Bacteroidota bacterium]
MITIQDIEKIEKYLEGKLSGAELRDFKQQLRTNPELAELAENFKFAVEGVHVYNRNQLKANFQKIQNEVAPQINKGSGALKYYIAGGAAVVLIALLFILNPFSKQNNEESLKTDIPIENLNSGDQPGQTEVNQLERPQSIQETDEIKLSNEQPAHVKAREQNTSETANVYDKDSKSEILESPHIDSPDDAIAAIGKINNNESSDDVPEAHFSSSKSSGCAPVSIHFTDHSSLSNGLITKWLWNFGDGRTSAMQNPVHVYDIPGLYTVKLTVWSRSGNSDMISKEKLVHVHIVPDAGFITDPEIVMANRPDVQFINKTQNITPGIKYSWDFGDHFGNSTETNPEYSYSDTGSYIVSLSASTENACVDKSFRGILVVPELSCYMPDAFSPDGKGPNENNAYQIAAQGFIDFYMIIYNRLGEVVHESTNYKKHAWDGSYPNGNNDHIEAEVFIVKVRLTGFDGKEYDFTKSVTLIR